MAPNRLLEAAEVIADGGRRRSAWSDRIPLSVHTVSRGQFDVLIVAGGERAPHAITFEAPNAPFWKHPVFGHGPRKTWHWVAQDPRRFLLPAAVEDSDRAVVIIAKQVDDWAAELGFRGE